MIEIRENIYGKGVYATKAIPKGAVIAPWHNVVGEEKLLAMSKEQLDIDRITKIGNKTYTLPSGDIDDYFNHSCDPNSGLVFETLLLIAIKDIHKDEEIVWDYSSSMDKKAIQMFPGWKMECLCGTLHCRKIVDSFDTLPNATRMRYKALGIVPDFLENHI